MASTRIVRAHNLYAARARQPERRISEAIARPVLRPKIFAGPLVELAFIAETCDDWDMAYPGGKGRAFQTLINLMPPHRVYVETHLGSGVVMRRKRRASINIGIEADPKVAALWESTVPDEIELRVGDCVQHLGNITFLGDELVYADPPYVAETRQRKRCYRYDYTGDDHERLLTLLLRLPCFVMISGYRNALYDARLQDWRRVDITAITQAGPHAESIWMNFADSPFLHDYSYIGSTFREREKLRRARSNLARKVLTSDKLLLNAVLSDVADADPGAITVAAARCRA